MKKWVVGFLAFVLALTVFSALPARAGEKTMTITYVKSPLNIPSIIEKHLGLLEAEFGSLGYTVSHPEITSGAQQTQAMAAGSVQVANCIGGTSLLLAASQGLDIKIAGIYSRAPKTYSLLVKDPAIKTIADLKGKKVAGPKGTVLHQLLLAGLKKAEVSPLDVEHIEMPIPTATAALMSDSIDGALAAGPAALKAIEGGARVLFDGEGLIEATILIGVSAKALEEVPDLPKRMLDIHRKALAYAADNPEEAAKIVSEETEIEIEQVKEMAKLYDFDPDIRERDIEDLKSTMQFLIDAELAVKYVDPVSLIAR
ncbi:MAG: NrtA/SsuA/CpmA family ABC transporter substrate-binding protein [Synergistaceae bacterium]|jgi:sulfonate transport system substrate-binding protein|nr:NrtA/SsuA/CpmA family ABC transporter substrate-binding protein [Synergistaceae bacterium]